MSNGAQIVIGSKSDTPQAQENAGITITKVTTISGSSSGSSVSSSNDYKGSSVEALLTGTDQFTPLNPTVQKVNDKGFYDLAKKQSVYVVNQNVNNVVKNVEADRQAQINRQVREQVKQAEVVKDKDTFFTKVGSSIDNANIKVSNVLGLPKIQNKLISMVDKRREESINKLLSTGQKSKADELIKLRDKKTIGLGATGYISEKPVNVAVSYGLGAGFKTTFWGVSKFVSPVITGSKYFKFAGYGLGASLVTAQGVIYYIDVKDTSFNEATGKLLVDVGAFYGGYKSAEKGINKITDLVRSRGLTKISSSEVFSPQTVKDDKIISGLAISRSFKSTVKQFKTGIKGSEGFVSTASPKSLTGNKVLAGEKAGLEDLGLYVSPKKQAQPLFTRVSGLDIPKSYSLNLFSDITVSEPTVTNIYGIKGIKIYPKKVLKVAGFQAVSEFASGQAGKGLVFPTKRSMIGQGVIKRQSFILEQDVKLGDSVKKAGSKVREAGTSEAEAILGVGEEFTVRPNRFYTEINGRRVIIDEKNLVVNNKLSARNTKKLSTAEIVKELSVKEAEYSRLRGSSRPISSGFGGSSSLSRSSFSGSGSSGSSITSSISGVSGSGSSGSSITSSISGVSGSGSSGGSSSKSGSSSNSGKSGRSSSSGKSTISNISNKKSIKSVSFNIPKINSKGSKLYDVTVGKFGKTKYFFSKRGVSLTDAIRFGKGKTLNTASASFKITDQSGNKVSGLSVLTDQRFRLSKKGDRFVQKSRYRISSFGEKQQITRVGISKNRKRLF